MSDQDLRKLLEDVIEDIDSGRVQPPCRPRRRLGRLIAGSALVAGLALAGCDTAQPAYGVPPTDAQTMSDSAVSGDAAVDADPVVDYGGPDIDAAVDSGPVIEYGGPDLDAAVDSGPVVDYGGPDVDAGP
ncbi:MAG: hypothetical protein ABI333_07840 [bacterium]